MKVKDYVKTLKRAEQYIKEQEDVNSPQFKGEDKSDGI